MSSPFFMYSHRSLVCAGCPIYYSSHLVMLCAFYDLIILHPLCFGKSYFYIHSCSTASVPIPTPYLCTILCNHLIFLIPCHYICLLAISPTLILFGYILPSLCILTPLFFAPPLSPPLLCHTPADSVVCEQLSARHHVMSNSSQPSPPLQATVLASLSSTHRAGKSH